MLQTELNEDQGILMLAPKGELSQSDFEQVAGVIDPFLEKSGRLNGIIIHSKSFPGWESFSAMVTHIKFIKSHHRKISRVALVTDSHLGNLAEHIAKHFISAEIKHFAFDELDRAKRWIVEAK
jgi:hypothetical protein